MIQFTQGSNSYILVEVPDGASDFWINNAGCIRYSESDKRVSSVIEPMELGFYATKEKYSIIGLFSEITEEQAMEMVKEHVVTASVLPNKYYNNYGEYECVDFRDIIDNSFSSATDSLRSRITSLGLNPQHTLILKLKK